MPTQANGPHVLIGADPLKRTMFDGVKERLALKLTKTRAFGNGSVFLCYEPKTRIKA
jgi:hypothetical protein